MTIKRMIELESGITFNPVPNTEARSSSDTEPAKKKESIPTYHLWLSPNSPQEPIIYFTLDGTPVQGNFVTRDMMASAFHLRSDKVYVGEVYQEFCVRMSEWLDVPLSDRESFHSARFMKWLAAECSERS